MNPDFSKYPICDTDIWVNLCLGDLLPSLFRKYEKIVFADVVEGEIMSWLKEPRFDHVAKEFISLKESGHVLVIEHDVHIEAENRIILEQILYDLGFKHDFKNKPPEKNKGEFVSAIYADHFRMPFFKTNDNAFQEGGIGAREYPELVIKNWYAVVEELVSNPRERIDVHKRVESESKRMEHHYQKHKEERKKEDLLRALAGKFNNKRL